MIALPEFRVLITNRAEKDLLKAQAKIALRIREAANFLKTNPVPAKEYDVTKISASYSIDKRKDRAYK